MFASRRDSYVTYSLRDIPGNRYRLGSVSSEIKHSSVLCYLNDGHKSNNTFCKDAAITTKELFLRQQKHVKLTNAQLYQDTLAIRIEIDRLNREHQCSSTKNLLKAANILNRPSYERFKRFLARTNEYRLITSAVPFTGSEECQVKSIRYPDAPPRVFKHPDDRCPCEDRVAEQDMCVHEILAKNGFHEKWYLSRYFLRPFVCGSVTGWQPQVSNDMVNSIEEEAKSISNKALACGVHTTNHFSDDDQSCVPSDMKVSIGDPENVFLTAPHPFAASSPLVRKRVQDVFNNVLNSYHKLKDTENTISTNVFWIWKKCSSDAEKNTPMRWNAKH